ncbi:MAG: hypothetical protein WBN40_14000, partial [Pseudomonadales bacterium]
MSSSSTATAQRAIDAARSVIDQSLRNIKQACSVDGRLKLEMLEQYQWVSFDLARSAAELAAAESTLAYAIEAGGASGQGSQNNNNIEAQIASAYCAEMFTNLRARLAPRLADFQLDAATLDAVLGNSELLDWAATQSAVANIVALGDRVRASDGHLGASVLDQEHQFMADTFGRFAIDVVDPLAEHIHRNDADIPDEI